MSSPQERMQLKFEELKGKIESIKPPPSLTELTIRTFCIGFHLPLIGSLAYLQQKTSTYQKISCTAAIFRGKAFIINDAPDYYVFARGLESIIAPTHVDFTFNLTESTYSIGTTKMNDIHVAFTVFFQKTNYALAYEENGQEVIRYTRNYDQDLDPEEIVIVRDRICNFIFDRVTENMEIVMAQT